MFDVNNMLHIRFLISISVVSLVSSVSFAQSPDVDTDAADAVNSMPSGLRSFSQNGIESQALVAASRFTIGCVTGSTIE